MKKILIATAVAASFASVAHAQSSVTLYGTLDAGLTYTSNVDGHAQWALGSGSVDENRFGLRGVEDLGGGLKTIFTLEQGFNLNNGSQAQSGKMFSRQAFVGLSSQAGTVTLGRQYDEMHDFVAPLAATGSWGGSNFAHFGNLDMLDDNSGVATNNSIKFTSANYAGFSFGGTYGFSNSSKFAANREYSFGAGYENAGLRIGAGYQQRNSPNVNDKGASDLVDMSGLDLADVTFRQRSFGAGASYAFGPAVVGLLWTQARFDNFTGNSASIHTNNYEVNAKYNLTPALGLGASYTYTNGAIDDFHFHANQFGLQGDYALSKRTDIYAQGVYQVTSSPQGTFVAAAIDNGNASGFSSSRRQAVASVGMRHRF
ncbi:Porin Gram-negative type [Paraburkholderia piptadeniae]|uniref:Porin Gram-negative type n=1 Tax=Paraburkholderia piptadeniae TaxID=1701573 RepID=A0A1N7SDE0_9BURK|nr:porin [Paraburkholderia piptadeniae]SIT45396.1 Porin Gram-negative type [Paraburkholderia piptadeniae]